MKVCVKFNGLTMCLAKEIRRKIHIECYHSDSCRVYTNSIFSIRDYGGLNGHNLFILNYRFFIQAMNWENKFLAESEHPLMVLRKKNLN